jgi:hypothetical protein
MTPFEEKLLRLKQELGVATDGEVAEALGLSKASLSDRKRRNSFPFDLVFSLSDRRPSGALDVVYVITGERISGHAHASAEAVLRVTHERGDEELMRIARAVAEAAAARQRGRQGQYKLLMDLADNCDDERLELAVNVMRALVQASTVGARARAVAAVATPGAVLSESASLPRTVVSQNFAGPVGQVTTGDSHISGGTINVGADRKRKR